MAHIDGRVPILKRVRNGGMQKGAGTMCVMYASRGKCVRCVCKALPRRFPLCVFGRQIVVLIGQQETDSVCHCAAYLPAFGTFRLVHSRASASCSQSHSRLFSAIWLSLGTACRTPARLILTGDFSARTGRQLLTPAPSAVQQSLGFCLLSSLSGAEALGGES